MPAGREEESTNDGRPDRKGPGGASGWEEDDWDRGSWDRDDGGEDASCPPDDACGGAPAQRPQGATRGPGTEGRSEAAEGAGRSLLPAESVRYTPPDPESAERSHGRPPGRREDSGEAIAFMLLAGVGVGAGIGYGIDRLVGSFPALMVVGVFVGFAVALYAVYLETR